MRERILIEFNNNTLIEEKNEILNKQVKIYQRPNYNIHICSRYIVIYDNNWKCIYSLKILSNRPKSKKMREYEVENIHPLVIDKDLRYNKLYGELKNKILILSTGMKIMFELK